MFRPIRRTKNAISIEEARKLLQSERRGVLAVNGDSGYPYAIPVDYLFCADEGRIYFHGASEGHKVDALKRNDRVCFTVYGNETYEDGDWAPRVQSAVVFGRCRLMDDPDRAVRYLRRFAEKYFPDLSFVEEEVSKYKDTVQMFEIEIEHLSGKTIRER